jgi:hypothetical protein
MIPWLDENFEIDNFPLLGLKKHHFQDLPDGIKKALGDIPEGFLNYFSRKFPSLLVHVYSIILESNLKTENLFATYFDLDEIWYLLHHHHNIDNDKNSINESVRQKQLLLITCFCFGCPG